MNYTYEIKPRPVELGSGWRLRLLENDKEVGGGIFPPPSEITDSADALQAAFEDAEQTAYDWLDAREEQKEIDDDASPSFG